MFNLWPKKKSVDEILEDVKLQPLNSTWTSIPEDSAKKDAVIKNLREQQEFLYKENEELKKILENIEEDGTYEHNKAVELRQENANLKYRHDELVKEVLGLRHLKEENVQLLERVNEIDGDMNKEYQAEIFTLKNDIAMWKAKNQIIDNNYKKCTEQRDEYKHQLNAANKEIEALKKDIKDYVFDKSEEIDKLKKVIEYYEKDEKKDDEKDVYYVCSRCGYKVAHNTNYYGGCGFCKEGQMMKVREEQKHPMYPIHWGGLDPDILKQAKEQSVEEVVESLKGKEMFKPWVEEPIDWKDKEFNPEELLKRVTEYADSLSKSFPNEFQQETTAENLEKKFDKGVDVLDYFEKPWQCPCNKCKETKTEKTWEQAASDLALRVVKLEKQIEELKLIKVQSYNNIDAHYAYFKKHGKWPWKGEDKLDSPKEYDNL